ncbi:AmmeMemoRadiSam system protein B [Halanaerobium saccharolyticum]|uniref:AmmeMemoRadiSam system protein B n=1 Tax=Halanaerobium saccharolyticum TaxID=43595 RepID=A0A4V3G5A2_9FIRM|nr:AmmeMemoRadiSam system protein B [Halanaerobium saccharolyticum]RAK07752.1 AmmeMemoRadiSam system protein B [Halanaerobium saccharolyticum]TDW03639.1 AmmeMemoRadiSam system protein B [Halanaerobium saccharolyticum]TDX59478.1 AmmeMemoRadiSam system protein B [Halanaerobium saccharolyticum]
MGVKCAALLPHPPIVIEEIGDRELKKAEKTVQGFKKTAEEIAEFKDELDLLIFITPHGPVFRSTASIIVKEDLKGNFSDFGHSKLKFSEKSDTKFAEKLISNVKEKNLSLQPLRKKDLRDYGVDQELDHGIMVPLNYLEKAGVKLPILPISIGFITYQELYKIGQEIARTASELDYKIAVIASGDLSHRLKKGAPAGFNPDAHLFDEKLMQYFKDQDFESILNFDQDLIEKAGECGLRPIITMLGTLDSLEVDVKVNSYEGPFGVGYGTVFINPKTDKK